eukprot:5193371-Prymnesium_polylepis.2
MARRRWTRRRWRRRPWPAVVAYRRVEAVGEAEGLGGGVDPQALAVGDGHDALNGDGDDGAAYAADELDAPRGREHLWARWAHGGARCR